ncbi:MAG TPA: aminopeptidase P family N-terminal domain-containing protein [Candidatus Angelobacter sp.]|jgi:hypothetical protein|nr:aminopeptidase P family N-terminal domain-containing protein [Candidatus Angelobacter sp.]
MTQLQDFFGADVDVARMDQDRRGKVAESMRRLGVDVLMLVDPLNVEYVTGVSQRHGGPWSVAVMTADQTVHTFAAPSETPAAAAIVPRTPTCSPTRSLRC